MERPNVFEDDDLDLPSFEPKPTPEEVRRVSESANFFSRESRGGRKPRLWRTGRTAQFNCRITPDAFDRFYAIADERGWKVGETVEFALAALEEKLKTS